MKIFRTSLWFSILAFGAAAWYSWNGSASYLVNALWACTILAVLEVSFSFDNAVVNAKVLETMDPWWQKMFLTVGMIIAVFGMRLVFPIAVVDFVTDMGFLQVFQLALADPVQYSEHLHKAHIPISLFGGSFLMLIFLNWLFDNEKDLHWIPGEHIAIKAPFPGVVSAVVTISAVTLLNFLNSGENNNEVFWYGLYGVALYQIIEFGTSFLDTDKEQAGLQIVKTAGLMSFLYLEVLDASFSFDGVIGAFAISKDIVIIMIGLGIGAMFVRSLTIFLVQKGTLAEYVYLEHGAHWAIGFLATSMLAASQINLPEAVTGLTGVVFIGAALWSSIRRNRDEKQAAVSIQ